MNKVFNYFYPTIFIEYRIQTLLLVFLFLLTINSKGQENENLIKLNGSIGISYENYTYNVQEYSGFRPKYPDNLMRINANGVLQISNDFSIPFGMNISNQKASYNLPNLPEEGIVNYIRNPRNNFHINPKYKWLKANLGSHTPKYSSLTTGDIQIFGLGVEMNPGKFIFSVNYGLSQYAIEPDVALNIPGAFKQKIISGRVGFGKIKGSKFTLNFVKLKDEVESVAVQPINTKPKEGISIAPLVEVRISKQLKLTSETAASVYTENLNANTTFLDENFIKGFEFLISLNNTSIVDFAHTTSLEWSSKKLQIGGEIKYIGPGFLSVGYRNIETDLIDYKLKTGIKLAKNKYKINAVLGVRSNNIKNTKLNKNNRFIGNVNVFAQFTQNFSLNVNYSNFGFRNNSLENAYRIEMVNNSFSLAPSYQIKSKTKYQQINATLSTNKFNQYDVFLDSFVATATNTLSANYLMSFIKLPLSFGANALYLNNSSEINNVQLTTYGLNTGYKFLNKKVSTNLMIGLSNIKRGVFTADKRINMRLKVNYKFNKTTESSFVYRLNNNQYGTYRPNAISNENKLKFSLIKKF